MRIFLHTGSCFIGSEHLLLGNMLCKDLLGRFCNCFFYKRRKIDLRLCLRDVRDLRAKLRMPRRKDRAAVLIGLD